MLGQLGFDVLVFPAQVVGVNHNICPRHQAAGNAEAHNAYIAQAQNAIGQLGDGFFKGNAFFCWDHLAIHDFIVFIHHAQLGAHAAQINPYPQFHVPFLRLCSHSWMCCCIPTIFYQITQERARVKLPKKKKNPLGADSFLYYYSRCAQAGSKEMKALSPTAKIFLFTGQLSVILTSVSPTRTW